MMVDLNGWWIYITSAAGFLFLLIAGLNALTAYNKWRERLAIERIETYLYLRFGSWKK